MAQRLLWDLNFVTDIYLTYTHIHVHTSQAARTAKKLFQSICFMQLKLHTTSALIPLYSEFQTTRVSCFKFSECISGTKALVSCNCSFLFHDASCSKPVSSVCQSWEILVANNLKAGSPWKDLDTGITDGRPDLRPLGRLRWWVL
jgi:hypothetical protein